MLNIVQSNVYEDWFNKLKDKKLKRIIDNRLLHLENGLLGDVKHIENKLWEIRIHYGAGYRIYYYKRGDICILLLCAGDKSTQKQDIARAKKMTKELNEYA
jgi:putative addiction module killer protein